MGHDQLGRSVSLPGREGVSDGGVDIALALEELAGPAFESLALLVVEQFEATSERLAEQLVVPVPPPLVIERDEEEVAGSFDLQQPPPR